MFSKNLGTVRIFIPNFEMFDHLKIVRIFYISFFKTHEDMLKMFLRTSETESNNSYTSSFFSHIKPIQKNLVPWIKKNSAVEI